MKPCDGASSPLNLSSMDPKGLLNEHFGFRDFLEGQEGVVRAILEGQDVLVIMPTGGGKSLCYQLPALALQGITVVVSPLIALMKDQVDNLLEKGVPATFINSSISPDEAAERMQRVARGEIQLLYVAPERFKSDLFLRQLAPLSVALFAVDEAHCISQWGHDFRPDYLKLRWVLKELGDPQVVALTATATPEVREDIVKQLDLGTGARRAPTVFMSGFARSNLTLGVTHVRGQGDKLSRIARIVHDLKTGIVYCATRKNVERVALELGLRGIRCLAYHGGMKDEHRGRAQAQFMAGECGVVVATNAFGMGIDRADLRFVVHHDIPGSVEAYYQEVGRAGRDGEPSRCELLFNYADVQTQEFFIEGANPTRETIVTLYDALIELCAGGPIERPISEIAGSVAAMPNTMAAGSSLYLLQRAGFIERDYRPGSRTYTTRLVQPIKRLDELDIDFAQLDEKRERDYAKLRQMIGYVDTRNCRHRYILEYFGDPEASERCNACDSCIARKDVATRLPNEEETVIIQKALSCVARVNGRFGRGRIAQVLVGSHSREVLDAKLDSLSTYGLLSNLSVDYITSLLNSLAQSGCVTVSEGSYPTLSLTALGGDVMRRKKRIPLVIPEGIAAKNTQREAGRSPSAASSSEGNEGDMRVFEALREWRRQRASAMGSMPAYLVYPDRTLKELACRLPRTEAELLEVRGIGPAKARQFGAETLAVIRETVS